jgi:hypothetical protein
MKGGDRSAADPDGYVAGIEGWQRPLVETLRAMVLKTAPIEERIKWTHLVYFSNGPVLLIRAEPARVLFGFWRGKRLRAIEPRLKPGGKYELATMTFREGDEVDPDTVKRLVREAVRLNADLGNPGQREA